jgi:hypothetical protein
LEFVAELIFPFSFLGFTYTHIAASKLTGPFRFWNYIGLLPGGGWWTEFDWGPQTKGFPWGALVVPD